MKRPIYPGGNKRSVAGEINHLKGVNAYKEKKREMQKFFLAKILCNIGNAAVTCIYIYICVFCSAKLAARHQPLLLQRKEREGIILSAREQQDRQGPSTRSFGHCCDL